MRNAEIDEIVTEAMTRAERERAQRVAEDVAAVLAATAGKAPDEVRTVAEFKISPTNVSAYRAGEVQITNVRVIVTRYAADDPEDDGTGAVRVEGHGRPLTKAGAPDKRQEAWWYQLPDELAAPLLLQAHMQTR